MKMDTQTVTYRDGDTELTGHFAWDAERADKRPGILVVHGGAGLDSHATGRAKRLAELGFVAFACDMYGNGVAGNRERVMARIDRKSTRLNSSHANISYAVFCLKKKTEKKEK